ncbi:hypothetical protein HDU76_008471 [Blyttiomyces sp. JEL0837]|nr:hypothetical protein HDU76_008471 [Blyttiomyces sp. JEL0837]
MTHSTPNVLNSADLNAMSAEEEQDFTTLYSLLAPYRVDEDKFYSDEAATMYLLRRILGTYPQTLTTFAIWRPLYTGIGALVPANFNIPACDAGVGPINAHMRRMVATVTSLTAQCAYCSAHCCGLGDAFKGGVALQKNPPPLKLLPSDISEKERVALRLVVAAVKVPARVTPQMRADVVKHWGVDGLQKIVAVCAQMGFLFSLNDTLGSELEGPSINYASKILPKHGWNAGRHNPPEEKKTHAKHPRQDPSTPCEDAIGPLTQCMGRNLLTNFVDLLSNVSKSTAETNTAIKKIPTSHKELNKWIQETFGFSPRYLVQLKSIDSKRGICYAIWSYLIASADEIPDENCKPTLSTAERLILAFIYFTSAENALVAGEIATLAHKFGVSKESINLAQSIAVTEDLSTITSTTSELSPLYIRAIKITWAVSRRYRTDVYRMVSDLTSLVDLNLPTSVRPIVELLALWAICSLLQRLSSGLDDEAGFETEVKAVVESEFGVGIGMKERGAVANSAAFHDEVSGYAFVKGSAMQNTTAGGSAVGVASQVTVSDERVASVEEAGAVVDVNVNLTVEAKLWGGEVVY